MVGQRLVCASANPDKVREIEAILLNCGVVLESRPTEIADVEENADTLEGNARLKASAIALATGCAALADDTGLEVDVLGGAPGVRSARYAGEPSDADANIEKLLNELLAVGATTAQQRRARFRTVVLVQWSDGTETIATGAVEGHIALERVGDGGFGYDPLFIPDEGNGRTFAQMSADEKHAMSHRGRALRTLAKELS
ncbi:MAG: RdgB/HAM1 family non-canonical purine NTP pyrophosphatase [Actinobacteria bacterium]|uniref:dITP/XTP pyrophosphatase n=1 Tax=freshwater metagenome TaxID=449393 RepID=A0A6J6XKX2_9ZZZZ|nr:RdgB/HAM1 family non-canonical purine NTP pyrophosphatase [Actinomycetota bacterium]MSY34500.1 RdgB/HAM1 family non-canonical purine NTP pyrophosphatase [Actinomycetota bacterium]